MDGGVEGSEGGGGEVWRAEQSVERERERERGTELH